MAKRAVYESGDVVGKLVYVREAEPYRWKGGHTYRKAIFVCGDCKEEFEAKIDNVKNGNTERCRKCADVLLRWETQLESSARELYSHYRYSAEKKRKRPVSFELPYEDFKRLTSENCYYCGDAPKSVFGKHRKTTTEGCYVYNGLDRVDNNKGYSIENCVPCCDMCNKAKRNNPVDVFLNWAFRLVYHQIVKSVWSGVTEWVNKFSLMGKFSPTTGTKVNS